MSLSLALDTALTSLRASQANIQVVSQNISNASDPGYSRRQVVRTSLSQATVQELSVGGVNIARVERATNNSINTSLLETTSNAALNGTQDRYLRALDDTFTLSGQQAKLSTTYTGFQRALRELSAQPESAVAQRQVLNSANELAQEVNRLASAVSQVDREILNETSTTVSDLNASLRRLQELNGQIVFGLARNSDVTVFQDSRDAELRRIAETLSVRTLERADGSVGVITPAGYTLLDGDPVQFTYNGSSVDIIGGATNVGNRLTGGKLEALLGLRENTSPATANAAPAREVVRKINEQLDLVVTSFTNSSVGPPATFAYAYNSAVANAGELPSDFFTGTNRFDFALNPALQNGTQLIKQAAAAPSADALEAAGRTFTAAGLNVTGASYGSAISSIISLFGQSKEQVKQLATLAENERKTYEKRLQQDVGVNIDEEVLQLTILQNSYQASARIVSVVQRLYDILDGIVR